MSRRKYIYNASQHACYLGLAGTSSLCLPARHGNSSVCDVYMDKGWAQFNVACLQNAVRSREGENSRTSKAASIHMEVQTLGLNVNVDNSGAASSSSASAGDSAAASAASSAANGCGGGSSSSSASAASGLAIIATNFVRACMLHALITQACLGNLSVMMQPFHCQLCSSASKKLGETSICLLAQSV